MRIRPITTLIPLLLISTFARAQIPDFDLSHHDSEIMQKQAALAHFRSLPLTAGDPLLYSYDVTHYEIAIEMDTSTSSLAGKVTMTAISTVADLSIIAVDLDSAMTVDSVGLAASAITRQNNTIRITLDRAYPVGDTFAVKIYYHGKPATDGFGAFGFDYERGIDNPVIWSLSEPYFARSWWPCKDIPNDKADSVDIFISVPGNLQVASNGTLRSVTPGDTLTTYHWHESYPISTYLVSVAIADYDTLMTSYRYDETKPPMDVIFYVYPEHVADSSVTASLGSMPPMLEFFSEIFGEYPFVEEKYGIAQFPWGGGMEHQTITSQGGFSRYLNAHELAHQWWGDWVTNANWHEIWLNEGFASYSEALWQEHLYGSLEWWMAYADQYEQFPYPLWVDDTTSVWQIFNHTVYKKGAWVLHMLRGIVGDADFFTILRTYGNEFAYSNATTADFQAVCETVSGQDLSYFFDAWIYQVGRPVYDMSWSVSNGTWPYEVSISLRQTQYPDTALFPMPIDFTFHTTGDDTIITLFNDQPDTTYLVSLPDMPISIGLDEDNWILKRFASSLATIEPPQIPTTFSLEQNRPNPFNPATTIDFTLAASGFTVVRIYNLLGMEIATLQERYLSSGPHHVLWNGKIRSGLNAPSGIYFYMITVNEGNSSSSTGAELFRQTRKMILLR